MKKKQSEFKPHKPYKYIKRFFDFILALLLLTPALVIISICVLLVKLESKGPAFFVQERPGYKGQVFKVFKIRTMTLITEIDGKPLSDIARITRVGKFIRKLSLDELPQLLNILLGNMSFIGPRPLLLRYMPFYSSEQMRRHDVRPGISGWAQVNGRNALSWEERFELDIWYVDNYSFILDLKILFLTFKNVIKSQNINSSDVLVMPYFDLSKEGP